MKKILISFAMPMLMLTLTGCETIPAPQTYSERTISTPSLPLRKALIVLDVNLEHRAVPSALLRHKDDILKDRYQALGAAMVEAVNAYGGEAEYVLHYSPVDPDFSKAGYSHVWLQRLEKMTAATYSNLPGTFISWRIWRGVISERQEKSGQFAPIYNVDYRADGPTCFTNLALASKEECRTNYINYVVEQLKKAGFTKQ